MGKVKEWLMKLEEDAHKLLKKPLAEPLLEAARIRLRMPDWPLDSLTLRTRTGPQGGLVLGVTTGLGAATTLDPALRDLDGPSGIRVHLPGATLTAVANRLAARGDLPQRVDTKGRPDPDGELAVTYGWRSGRRPLKLDIWRLNAPCAALRVGGTPAVDVEEDGVHLAVSDGRLERVRGDLLVKVGAALTRLWSRAFRMEVEALRSIVVRIGGRRLRLSMKAVLDHAEGWAIVL